MPGVGRCRIFGRTDVRTPPDQLPTVRRPQDARWLHYAAECRRPRLAARSRSAPHHGSHRPMTRARFQSVWHHGHAQCVLRAARGLLEFGGLATAEEAGTHAPLRRFCDARAGALWSICSRSPGFEQDWAPSTPPQPPAVRRSSVSPRPVADRSTRPDVPRRRGVGSHGSIAGRAAQSGGQGSCNT